MPEVWISKLVVLLTEEDMPLTVFCYCIFSCAHRCCSFKTVFKSFVFITFYLSYVAVSRPCCLLKFYPKNRALSKTRHYHLNSVHAEYRRTLITWTWITQIPRFLKIHLLSLDQDFTEIYPDNSNFPLTQTVIRFPLEFELPGFYYISQHIYG